MSACQPHSLTHSPSRAASLVLMALVFIVAAPSVGAAQAQPEMLITLQVSGGDHAGDYELIQDDSSCLYGSGNGDDWRILTSVQTSDPAAMSTFLLLVPSGSEAAAGSPNFFISAGFGEYGGDDYLEVILEPEGGNGTGTVTIAKDGDHATLSVSGQTSAGVSLSATVTCNHVLEISSEPKALSELGELTFGPSNGAATGSLELGIGDKTYALQTGEEVSCERDVYEQEGNFHYSYYAEGYNSLDLFIPDFEAAKTGTSDFGFAVDSFYLIYRTGEGSGTVKVAQEGDHLTLDVAVTTPEGTPVRAKLECLLAH